MVLLMASIQVPDDLSSGTHVNGDNIYIGETTPKVVADMFREQFERDFDLFLSLRHKELVPGGCMVLTFVGRKQDEMPMQGGVARVWEVLSQALQFLVQKVQYYTYNRGELHKKTVIKSINIDQLHILIPINNEITVDSKNKIITVE